jgi:predicted nucleotidyltransferase
MKRSLAHLPQHKRDELNLIVKIIRRRFPSAHMIVLFGSFARGQWVEDIYTQGHITYEYISDFDILVLTRLKEGQYFFSDIKKEGIILYDSGKLNYQRKRAVSIMLTALNSTFVMDSKRGNPTTVYIHLLPCPHRQFHHLYRQCQ